MMNHWMVYLDTDPDKKIAFHYSKGVLLAKYVFVML